jgi:hypothetical protein
MSAYSVSADVALSGLGETLGVSQCLGLRGCGLDGDVYAVLIRFAADGSPVTLSGCSARWIGARGWI